MNYSEPSHENSPTAEFKPIENGNIHYLDINNDGLTTGLRPNQKAMEFWTSIEKQAITFADEFTAQKRNEL